MPTFSDTSKKNLEEAHEDLQKVFNEVIKYIDCKVIEGFRSQVEQDKTYFSGKSKLKYPESKHNQIPCLAVDVVPYPIDWNDRERFYYFAGVVSGVSKSMGIDIR